MKKILSLLLCSALCVGMLSGCRFNISQTMKERAAAFAQGKDTAEPIALGLDEALLEKIEKYTGSLYIPRITVSSEPVQINPENPTFTVSCEDDLMQVLADAYVNIWTTVNIRYENDYLSDHTDQEKTELLYQLQNRVRRADPLNASNMLSLKLSENVLFIAYYCSADMLKTRNKETVKMAREKAEQIRQVATTEYQMVLEVNRLLCDEVVYPELPCRQAAHTPYGALISHEAVCDGYATAAMLILRELGISCDLLFGWGTGMDNQEPTDDDLHAWNLVRLNNRWYQLDITWNDGAESLNRYLLVSDLYMALTHKWEPGRYPETPWLRFQA
jgi:transglutaminase/protease-like cytokinesis protein 3